MYPSLPQCIPELGFKALIGNPYIWHFQDADSDTNFILRRRTNDNIWDFRDGRPSVERTFWTGKIESAKQLVSLMMQFAPENK